MKRKITIANDTDQILSACIVQPINIITNAINGNLIE